MRNPRRELAYYSPFWGIDSFKVEAVESGELGRFSYRIVDSEKARLINDKKIDEYLIDRTSNVKYSFPRWRKLTFATEQQHSDYRQLLVGVFESGKARERRRSREH